MTGGTVMREAIPRLEFNRSLCAPCFGCATALELWAPGADLRSSISAGIAVSFNASRGGPASGPATLGARRRLSPRTRLSLSA
jgi:hypothetical protein